MDRILCSQPSKPIENKKIIYKKYIYIKKNYIFYTSSGDNVYRSYSFNTTGIYSWDVYYISNVSFNLSRKGELSSAPVPLFLSYGGNLDLSEYINSYTLLFKYLIRINN